MIACPVKAVESTATASTPGTTTSTRGCPVAGSGSHCTLVIAINASRGSMKVSSSCSPLPRTTRVSNPAWATTRCSVDLIGARSG
jgi:hypothetical protein